jgi:hypothetical protein
VLKTIGYHKTLFHVGGEDRRLCKEKGDLRFPSTSLRYSFHHMFKFRKHFHAILELKENIGHAIQRLEALIQRTGS